VTTGAISRVKLQSNHHHQQTNIQFFTGRMPFLSPNQQCQSTEGKNITFHGLAYPKLTWGLSTLSLTTNSSWLPWGRVAMPLISPLMPAPQLIQMEHGSKITTYGNDYSTSPILFHLLNLPILPRSLQTALDPTQYSE